MELQLLRRHTLSLKLTFLKQLTARMALSFLPKRAKLAILLKMRTCVQLNLMGTVELIILWEEHKFDCDVTF